MTSEQIAALLADLHRIADSLEIIAEAQDKLAAVITHDRWGQASIDVWDRSRADADR